LSYVPIYSGPAIKQRLGNLCFGSYNDKRTRMVQLGLRALTGSIAEKKVGRRKERRRLDIYTAKTLLKITPPGK
jgi:hypothetical protein